MRLHYSFVVDRLPEHYYQAELLLHSLERIAGIPRERILVHCVEGVSEAFTAFLDRRGIPRRTIRPFLDGTYCNKLRQLDSFIGRDGVEGVALLDTDTVLLEPLDGYAEETVRGKIVDGPNPAPAFLERIFAEAGLSAPRRVPTDFDVGEAMTLDGYFNGGLYLVPAARIAPLSEAWKRWATWLYERRERYATIHVDQISMLLALRESGIPYRALPSNCNLPLHRAHTPRYYNRKRPIALLHYHRELDGFGRIGDTQVDDPSIRAAVARVNDSLAERGESPFYAGFLEGRTVGCPSGESSETLGEAVRRAAAKLPPSVRVILHGGTPKTGTTSLQHYFHAHRDTLRERGVLYPEVGSGDGVPKHQWIVQTLRAGEYDAFFARLERAFAEADAGTHTLFLSTEGIYNHWLDFSPEARRIFALLGRHVSLELWFWFRHPAEYALSYYRQNLKNPRIEGIDCYGTDLALSDLLRDPWCSARLNYLHFLLELERCVGAERIRVMRYEEGDVLRRALELLETGLAPERSEQRNRSLGGVTSEMLRIANRYPVSWPDKQEILRALSRIDEVLRPYTDEAERDRETKRELMAWFAPQMPTLCARYGLCWAAESQG